MAQIDCNGNDVTQKSKDFIDNLEEGLIKSERQFKKLKEELHATAEMHDDGCYYLRDEWIDEYIDKYMQRKEDKE